MRSGERGGAGREGGVMAMVLLAATKLFSVSYIYYFYVLNHVYNQNVFKSSLDQEQEKP